MVAVADAVSVIDSLSEAVGVGVGGGVIVLVTLCVRDADRISESDSDCESLRWCDDDCVADGVGGGVIVGVFDFVVLRVSVFVTLVETVIEIVSDSVEMSLLLLVVETQSVSDCVVVALGVGVGGGVMVLVGVGKMVRVADGDVSVDSVGLSLWTRVGVSDRRGDADRETSKVTVGLT